MQRSRPARGDTGHAIDVRSPLRIDFEDVRAFLLDHGAPISADTLRTAGLAPYAYCVLSPEDPRRPRLRGEYLRSLRRHHEIRVQVAHLLGAWERAGIESLVFKGFHLAELVYPKPGMRFHGDVDVLIRPADADAAVAAARADGWVETLCRPSYSHEVCGLFGPSGTKIDLQRHVLHRHAPWPGAQPRITRAVWERAESIDWEGTTLRVPMLVDALLVGLVLQRLWSEGGYLKPHDAIDFRLLEERVGGEELRRRARELRCTRTLSHFLEICDPALGRLELLPNWSDRVHLASVVRRERGLLGGRFAMRLLRAPRLMVDIVGVLPEVAEARRRIRMEKNLLRLLERSTPQRPTMRTPLPRRYRTVRAIRWATRLLRLNRSGDCVLRSFAIYSALARQGWPVAFVSGVRRVGTRVEGHAWVECDGRVLPELYEPSVRFWYREMFRWPTKTADRTAGA